MKILTVNFLTCAVKACKTSPLSFPLHFADAKLEQSDIEYNPSFLRNILPRIDWEAFKVTANEVCALLVQSTHKNLPFSLSSISTFNEKSRALRLDPVALLHI